MTEFTGRDQMVSSEGELLEVLRSTMNDVRYDDMVVMAGHFMLFFDACERCLRPGIYEDIRNERLREQVKSRVGIFPSYTWDLGIRLGDHFRERHDRSTNLLLLVNDWQYVPDEGKAGDYRSSFYENFSRLPPTYANRLGMSSHLGSEHLLPSRRHPIAFPETWLRYRFQNKAAQLVKGGRLQKRYLDEKPGQSEISFTDPSGLSLPLISCGVTGCAGEIVEMISEVHRAGRRYMIILTPGECHSPVRAGIGIALSLYGLSGMKILVADPGGSGEPSLDAIYGKGVNVTTFLS